MQQKGFFRSAIQELREIKWPTRKRAIEVSTVTLIFVGISAVALMFLDAGLRSVLYPGEAELSLPTANPTSIQATDADGNPVNIQFTDDPELLEQTEQDLQEETSDTDEAGAATDEASDESDEPALTDETSSEEVTTDETEVAEPAATDEPEETESSPSVETEESVDESLSPEA